MYDKAVLTNASREGARFGIVATTPRKTNRADPGRRQQLTPRRNMINYKQTAADTAITTITCQAPAPTNCTPAQRTSGVLMIVTSPDVHYTFVPAAQVSRRFERPFNLDAVTVMRME